MKTNILLVFFLLSITCLGCSNKPKQFDINVNYDNELRIMIPVKMGDTIIQMLWDTGCSNTLLSKELADKLSIKLNKNKLSKLKLFRNKVDHRIENSFEFDSIDVCYSNQVELKIGDLRTTSELIILENLASDIDLAVLGNDVMYRYYYAMHMTDKYMTLSDKPITFDINEITDSLEFRYGNDHLMIGKIQVNQDSLRLVFDSGMLISTQYKKNTPIYFDLVLLCQDSTSVTSNIYNQIKDKYKIDLTIIGSDNTVNKGTYGEDIAINSYLMNTYINHANVTHDRYDGILNMAFLARFDVMYCNPFDRVIKLYKLKGRESLMKVIPFYEYVRGINGIEYTDDGDSIKHKDMGEVIKKRFK